MNDPLELLNTAWDEIWQSASQADSDPLPEEFHDLARTFFFGGAYSLLRAQGELHEQAKAGDIIGAKNRLRALHDALRDLIDSPGRVN